VGANYFPLPPVEDDTIFTVAGGFHIFSLSLWERMPGRASEGVRRTFLEFKTTSPLPLSF